MTVILYNGKKEAERLNKKTAKDISTLKVTPSLGIIMTQNEPSQIRFTRYKQKAAQVLGIQCDIIQADTHRSTNDFIKVIKETAPGFTGILVQLPIPSHIDKFKVLNAIPCEKDVEGLGRNRVGELCQSTPDLYSPAAMAVVAAIDSAIATGSTMATGSTVATCDTTINNSTATLKGKEVVIIGNNYLIGQPVSQVLYRKGATITLCGRNTKNLAAHTLKAEILISCTGNSGLISTEMVKPDTIVIDAGFEIDSSGQIQGDVNPAVAQTASFFTPVPGGIGPVTIAFIYQNLIALARK